MKLNFSVGGAQIADIDRKYFHGSSENILTLGASSYVNGLNLWLGYGKNIPHHTLIGRFCSLSWELVFMIAYNHNYKNVSTFFTENLSSKSVATFKNPRQVIIGHDVWIGYGVTVMGGVKIGNGAVIGANAVVAKDVPPYAIAVGNPARVIKYRFDAETVKKFLAVKWWNWSREKIADNLPLMDDVEKFLAAHYTPALAEIPEDDIGRQIASLRAQGCKVYNFIADFSVEHPLWIRVVLGFCRSNFADAVLVIWLGKDSTDRDFELLAETVQIFSDGAAKNIIVAETQGDLNFSPYALRQGTHFITNREMTTLEALDYLWDTDVKIVSALDDGIFDGEPPVEWQAL